MALLWCDGFDHYGLIGNLTEGAWAEVASFTLITSNPRTGTYAVRRGNVSQPRLRRVLGGAKTAVGVGMSVYLSNLPTSNDRAHLFHFQNAANQNQITVTCQSTGTISIFRGIPEAGGTLLFTTATPVLVAEAYQHVEAYVLFSDSVGIVEVRVNGVTVVSLAGISTVNTAAIECSQVYICSRTGGTSDAGLSMDIDDVFCWDDTGSFNNTFLGDRRVLTLLPDADTAEADWSVVGAANGYAAINEIGPNADTSYIGASAGSPAPVSEFGISDLPAGISAITAVVVVEMARKTEAGPANTQWSIVSGVSESAGADKPLTEVYTYRQDVFETDPATAAPFTVAALNAARIKVERTQ